MSEKKWYETLLDGVAAVAPTVANLVMPGSGKAVDLLMRAVTGDKESPIEDVAEKIGADPAMLLEFQRLTAEKELELGRQALEAKRIANDTMRIDQEGDRDYLGDRAGARARDTAIQASGKANKRADWMVFIAGAGLVACVVALVVIYCQTPDGKEPPVGIITVLVTFASYFGLCLRDAYSFEFGSSRGSRDKDEAIKNMVPIEAKGDG